MYINYNDQMLSQRVTRREISMLLGILKTLLTPQFSDHGSNKRSAEEAAYIHYIDFLDDCEGKYRPSISP